MTDTVVLVFFFRSFQLANIHVVFGLCMNRPAPPWGICSFSKKMTNVPRGGGGEEDADVRLEL